MFIMDWFPFISVPVLSKKNGLIGGFRGIRTICKINTQIQQTRWQCLRGKKPEKLRFWEGILWFLILCALGCTCTLRKDVGNGIIHHCPLGAWFVEHYAFPSQFVIKAIMVLKCLARRGHLTWIWTFSVWQHQSLTTPSGRNSKNRPKDHKNTLHVVYK